MAPVGIRAVRAYVRWMPGNVGKRALVERLVDRRLSHRALRFVARTIHGARLGGDHRLIMPRCIYWFGVWEPLLSRWVEERLAPGDVFVDVGANMGYFSLLAATRVGPSGRVVAIEPAPPTFAKLRANLALNPGAAVRPVQAAVGAGEGRVPFYRAPWNDAESSTVPRSGGEAAGEVQVFPLAGLLADDEISRTRIVKIDIEGGEWDAVRGVAPDIDRFPADTEFAIEVHPDDGPGRDAATLAGLLAPHGFVPSWLPVEFRSTAHLDRRPAARPVPGLPPPGRLVHLILSRPAPLGAGASGCENPRIAERYQRPDRFSHHVLNPAIAALTRLGLSVAGSRVLEVRGRKSGQPRRTPVNVLTIEGARYLVAPRGHTHWVRNLRVRGEGRLLVGRRAERFTAVELSDDEKPALLRAYLRRWKWEVGAFFGGVGPEDSDDELRRIAPDHPVFRISS
jgi:deazaflavin-dependent oxidoreductase (nitroreductase family)